MKNPIWRTEGIEKIFEEKRVVMHDGITITGEPNIHVLAVLKNDFQGNHVRVIAPGKNENSGRRCTVEEFYFVKNNNEKQEIECTIEGSITPIRLLPGTRIVHDIDGGIAR